MAATKSRAEIVAAARTAIGTARKGALANTSSMCAGGGMGAAIIIEAA